MAKEISWRLTRMGGFRIARLLRKIDARYGDPISTTTIINIYSSHGRWRNRCRIEIRDTNRTRRYIKITRKDALDAFAILGGTFVELTGGGWAEEDRKRFYSAARQLWRGGPRPLLDYITMQYAPERELT